MKQIEIVLGGKAYTVAELPLRKNAAWRQQVGALVGEVAGLVEATQIDLNSTADLIGVVNQVRNVLVAAPDQLTALLFDYSPTLAADRERIEAEVYESELLSAFVEVLKLAFPFGEILSWASGLAPTVSAPTSTS